MDQNVQCKQEKCNTKSHSHHKYKITDKLFARNFHGSQKWIPAQVTTILGPLSYQVQTNSGNLMCRHIN